MVDINAAKVTPTATKSVNLKARTGNRVIVKFGGVQVGLVQSVRMNDSVGLEPASGVGDIHVVEYVPTQAKYQISVSTMVLFMGAMREAGITTIDGDQALEGLVFDIVVTSKDDGTELRKYIGCSFDSGDIDIQAHKIIMANAQFYALNVTGTGL